MAAVILAILLIIFLIPFVVCFGAFLIAFHREPRRLRCGVLLALSGLFLALFLSVLLGVFNSQFPDLAVTRLITRVSSVLLGLIGLVPLGLIVMTLVQGIMMLVKHGLHLRNSFAVLFSVVAILYMIVWPIIGDMHMGRFSTMLYIYISGIFGYTILLKTILTLTSELNLRHRKGPKGLDYVLVLGRPLKREPVVQMVRERVEKGIEVCRMNPGARLVLSGSYRVDDGRSVCEEMAAYAKEQGMAEADILLEREGASTHSMVTHAWELMQEDHEGTPKFAIVSTAYHVLRALIIARKEKIPCIGYGARTKLSVSTNAFIREYMLYMKLTLKGQLILLAVYTVLYWIGSIVLMRHGVYDPTAMAVFCA